MSPVVTSLPFQISGPPSMPSPAGPISHHHALIPGPFSASAQHSRPFAPARFSDQALNQGFRAPAAGGLPAPPFFAAQAQASSTAATQASGPSPPSSSPASPAMAPAATSRGAIATTPSPSADSSPDLKRTSLPFRGACGAPPSVNAASTPTAAAAAANVPPRSGTCASRHMAAEQRRRARINERLEALREIVPHSARANTAAFLTEVYDYVASLQRELSRRSEHAPDAGAEQSGKGQAPKKSAGKTKAPVVDTKGQSREESPHDGASDSDAGEPRPTTTKPTPGLDLSLGSAGAGAGREEVSELEPESGSRLRRRAAPGSKQSRGAFSVYVAASKGGKEGIGAKAEPQGSPARSPKQEGSGDESEDGGDHSDDGANAHQLMNGQAAGAPRTEHASLPESPRRQNLHQQHALPFPLCGYPGPTAPHLAFAGAPLPAANLGKAALALTLGPAAPAPAAGSGSESSPSSAAVPALGGAVMSLPGGGLGTAFQPTPAGAHHGLMMAMGHPGGVPAPPRGHPGGVPAPPRVPGPAQQGSRKRKESTSANGHPHQLQQQPENQHQHLESAGTLPFMMPPPPAPGSAASAAGSSSGTAGAPGSGAPGAGSMPMIMPMLPQMHPVAMAAAAAAAADAAAAAAVQQWNMAAAVAQAQAQAAVQAHAQAQALVSAVAASSHAAAASTVAGSSAPALAGPLPLPQPNGLAPSSVSRPHLMLPPGAPSGHALPLSALTPPAGSAPAPLPSFAAPSAPPASGAGTGSAGAPAAKKRRRGAHENKDSTGQGAQPQRVVRPIAVRPRP